jgi:SOS-response transcriptional repressor LexA
MLRQDELQERHQQMLDYQAEIAPFPPTLREMMIVWKLQSTSAAAWVLRLLTKQGLCVTRKGRYYAIEAKSPFVSTTIEGDLAGATEPRTNVQPI